jgi:hypothetical protein
MNIQEYQYLSAERTTVHRLLDEISPDDVLERSGLEARLEELEQQLASTTPPSREPARARLTFRGRPVVGHHGIFAEFGTKAVNAFADAVAKVGAALSGPLSAMGPIPNREESQLLITSTAFGSFGFELEEHRPSGQLDFGDERVAGQAIEMTRNLLQSTLGTDDELADSAANTDPRALEAVRSFLDLLATNEAVCALEFNDQVFRFSDVGQVRRSLARIGRDNLHEERTELVGEFQGVLPKGRTFEFKLATSNEVVRGKVGPAIADPEIINRHLHQPATIQALATRVGSGRPRYVLMAVPAWEAAAGEAAEAGAPYGLK